MIRIAVMFLFACLSAPAWAQEKDWENRWRETLAGAKKEGRVVVVGAPDPAMRNEIIPKFTARYGIKVEFLAGRASETAARIRMERSAGHYTADVYMGNPGTPVTILYPEKVMDPLRPLLVLPEVADPSKWKKGKLWFIDPEEKYILRIFNSVNSLFHINTDHVKPDEIRSARDLLNPKWKGKIATEDPSAGGKGAFRAAKFYRESGEEFFKKLYLDQKPMFSRERRQINDWLARGTHPICLTCREEEIAQLRKEGFKLLEVFELSDMKGDMGASPWVLTVLNKAPHPNAAQVFVNWIISKEALEIYSRGHGSPTLRTDLDESFLRPQEIPLPGVHYFDVDDWNWLLTGQKEAIDQVKKLLKPQ